MDYTAKINSMVDEMVPTVKPLVEVIEAKPETTQYHYGDYLSLLSVGSEQWKQRIVAMAALKAGANPMGIAWAAKLLGI